MDWLFGKNLDKLDLYFHDKWVMPFKRWLSYHLHKHIKNVKTWAFIHWLETH